MIKLNVTARDKKSPLKELRNRGFVPAVYYGTKEAPVSVSVKEIDFLKAFKEAGESTVVVLKDEKGEHESLIHDIQKDPVSGKIIHADFYVLEKGKKVKVKVPLEFVGVSPAVKELGGSLVRVLHELEIEAKPSDLPKNIEVNIESLMDFESKILAKDIKLGAGVELIEKPDEVVALATPPKEEVEEEQPVFDATQVEVEKKGKKDEEGEETSGAAPAEEKKPQPKDK